MLDLFKVANQIKSSERKGELEVIQLKDLCLRLAKFLQHPQDVDLFISCAGVGLQFLILCATQDLKSELEFDCRGKVVIIPKKFASIEVGEIKSSATGLSFSVTLSLPRTILR